MNLKVRSRRGMLSMRAMMCVTVLILEVSATGSAFPGKVHGNAERQIKTGDRRPFRCGPEIGIKLPRHDNPLIHVLMTSAISIAGRL